MSLITLTNAQLAYGDVPLLDHADCALEEGERVGLIGRNGAGKSSLLKVLAGLEAPDDGSVQWQGGSGATRRLRLVYVPQEPVFAPGATVFDAVGEGVAEVRTLRARYEALAATAGAAASALDALQTRIEALDGWTWEQRVAATLARLHLAADAAIEALSGGMKKRVALARALVARPRVLLLDEPTNHLDLDAITWLEALLRDFHGAIMLVTHDRAFLDAVATRILELDRGHLRSYPGNFAAYQAAKTAELAQEEVANARADKRLAQEEVWIRQGVEARRTRSAARIARLEALRSARAERREALGRVHLAVDRGAVSGKIVAELEHVCKSFGAQRVIDDFSATILRGDKVGLIGPNGAGKTTLLRIILGTLAPESGRVRRGTHLSIAYYDQLRAQVDPASTLADFISPGSEWIEIGDERKHVMSYLADFLFAPQRARAPVAALSGGERNRLLLARLFARPANVLVLDEPTNDLDIDTLELLEGLLQDYSGTVFLVSHDRQFLDHVVTSTIAWEGDAHWREYAGGYADWLHQSARAAALAAAPAPPGASARPTPAGKPRRAPAARPGHAVEQPRRLGTREQRELDELPARIDALEAEQKTIGAKLADAELYRSAPRQIAPLEARYAALDRELSAAMARWEELGRRA